MRRVSQCCEFGKTLQAFIRGIVSLHVPSRGPRSRQTPKREFPRLPPEPTNCCAYLAYLLDRLRHSKICVGLGWWTISTCMQGRRCYVGQFLVCYVMCLSLTYTSTSLFAWLECQAWLLLFCSRHEGKTTHAPATTALVGKGFLMI